MENDYDREDVEFEREKEEGYYQPSKNAEEASTTRDKGNMAIGAIYALMGSIVAFVIVGYLLDRFLETSPWFIVGGVLLGTIIGFYQFIRISGKN
jgi:F0F1-type ATP synthase assembly protein I